VSLEEGMKKMLLMVVVWGLLVSCATLNIDGDSEYQTYKKQAAAEIEKKLAAGGDTFIDVIPYYQYAYSRGIKKGYSYNESRKYGNAYKNDMEAFLSKYEDAIALYHGKITERQSIASEDARLADIKKRRDLSAIREITNRWRGNNKWRNIHSRFSMANLHLVLYNADSRYSKAQIYGLIKELNQLVEENKDFTMSVEQKEWLENTNAILTELYDICGPEFASVRIKDKLYALTMQRFGKYLSIP
jgi:hypothetical protein